MKVLGTRGHCTHSIAFHFALLALQTSVISFQRSEGIVVEYIVVSWGKTHDERRISIGGMQRYQWWFRVRRVSSGPFSFFLPLGSVKRDEITGCEFGWPRDENWAALRRRSMDMRVDSGQCLDV